MVMKVTSRLYAVPGQGNKPGQSVGFVLFPPFLQSAPLVGLVDVVDFYPQHRHDIAKIE